MTNTDYSEDTLVEQPAIALFSELGYDTANCFYEKVGTSDSTLGRETTEEVVLVPKLRSALKKLNPELDSEAINLAIDVTHARFLDVEDLDIDTGLTDETLAEATA